ncbi:MAG: TonB-dependent receptor, partial [Pseudomonadota bacterium]
LRTRLAHDGGFRADAGFDQGHLNLDAALPAKYGAMHAHIAAAALQQETAGFVRGFDAFRQPAVARSNPNPEAFRDAWAVRGGLTWTPGRWTLRPFFRRSQMAFLQHFLPGQPLEVNAQTSGGLSLEHRLDSGGPLTLTTRALVEASEMSLREDQAEPVSFGSAFLRATRPAGRHYDFSVDGLAATLTGALAWRAGERQTVEVGLRLDGVRYRYRTRLTAGNNDDQGNPCGFGGCLFTRPDDRSDRFFEWAPSVRWRGALSSRTSVFASLARGVRMPQITELYRLQSGQTVADLSPEVIDSVELGVAHSAPRQRWQITSFAAIKRNGIFRDADGFNVNAARTLHAGAELDGRIELHPRATLSASVTLAAHRYRFDRLTGGEPIRRNDDVDTAPRTLGNVGLTLTPIGDLELHLEWEHMGSYWLDAANAHRYGGHDLVHANLRRSVGDWTLGVKLRNVMNRAFAERADFAFGQYRYFPGQPRSAYVWVSRRL